MEMKDLDADGDGKVTLEEFRAAHDKGIETMFSKMDKDGDGALTEAELKAAKEHMHGHHHRHRDGSGSPPAGSSS